MPTPCFSAASVNNSWSSCLSWLTNDRTPLSSSTVCLTSTSEILLTNSLTASGSFAASFSFNEKPTFRTQSGLSSKDWGSISSEFNFGWKRRESIPIFSSKGSLSKTFWSQLLRMTVSRELSFSPTWRLTESVLKLSKNFFTSGNASVVQKLSIFVRRR